ncbi:MAG: transcriptional repressor LexA [Verrucomicrobiae bacterium]|nr:transcriptional repressor LexA [Verrucomicrobiae bacterium]
MSPLTDAQRRVFELVRSKVASGEPAPTLREIAATFGWKSKRAAACHLQAIVAKGWLTSDPGKARSLRLAGPGRRGSPATAAIPLLGSIPAGFGAEREAEDGGECVPVAVDTLGFKPTRNTFALRVSGDSMIGRHICDGDIAVFEHGPEPRPGQIVAALIDRKNTLKTFVVRKGRPFLKAENPKYPDLIPSEELMIQGVFRALIRRVAE